MVLWCQPCLRTHSLPQAEVERLVYTFQSQPVPVDWCLLIPLEIDSETVDHRLAARKAS